MVLLQTKAISEQNKNRDATFTCNPGFVLSPFIQKELTDLPTSLEYHCCESTQARIFIKYYITIRTI